MRINITTPFKFAHEGVHVRSYETGIQDVSDDCAELAIAEGWGKEIKARKARATRADTPKDGDADAPPDTSPEPEAGDGGGSA